MKKERSYDLDAIRVLACLMVIVMHAPLPLKDESMGFLLVLVSYLTAPCIGLFFMVSGALLLPVKLEPKEFLQKRLSKVLYPTLFWSLFYIACNYFKGTADGVAVLTSLAGIPLAAQGHGVLWFMYVLIGLYLLAPVITPWLKQTDSKTLQFYLFLWGVTLCVPFLKLFLSIGEGENFMLFYFSGYAGYFLLGYYLHHHVKNPIGGGKKSCLIITLGVIIVFLPPLLCKLFQWEVNFYSLFGYLSIGIGVMCLFWFRLINSISFFQCSNRITLVLVEFSKMSFGIYLIHIFVMRELLWNWPFLISLPVYFQIPLCSILTFFISYGGVKVISKLPLSKYIIGC